MHGRQGAVGFVERDHGLFFEVPPSVFELSHHLEPRRLTGSLFRTSAAEHQPQQDGPGAGEQKVEIGLLDLSGQEKDHQNDDPDEKERGAQS